MNKLLFSAVLLFSSSSFAGLIGNIEHNYGTTSYIPSSMGTKSCDTKNANSITIKDTSSGCQRFADVFDFSALDFATISHFELDLTFSGTNNRYCFIFCFNEDWRILPASNGQRATLAEQTKLTRASGITQQTFVFDANTLSSLFNDIVDSKKFSLWFSEEAFGANNFNLYSANLSVYGTAASQPVADEPAKVPAPASIALLGLGLLMLRRFKK
ncbi:PEP-CTERM sorting domain-containing protein [Rheinheimera sp. D18]|uniref:PEP-CTERM sorting domain-containing protein n=1 Tax=Rheinheimera sp. D18 TaxID=2545632 RepID=UPI001045330F|nr:PEP-CTERM sorting domain-containing protein [Rheinheimera sp. D18]QBL08342.1 PEP-CTERM sorting domain-containing protein [Rheinheimera sp. D18]